MCIPRDRMISQLLLFSFLFQRICHRLSSVEIFTIISFICLMIFIIDFMLHSFVIRLVAVLYRNSLRIHGEAKVQFPCAVYILRDIKRQLINAGSSIVAFLPYIEKAELE